MLADFQSQLYLRRYQIREDNDAPVADRQLQVQGKTLPPTDALRYLSRHGLKAELHELAKDGSVEQTLAREAGRLGAQLLVLGAYGHSRVREFLFGGVTRYFLEEASAPPLLLAH